MAFVFVSPCKEVDSAVFEVTACHYQYGMYPQAAGIALLIGGGRVDEQSQSEEHSSNEKNKQHTSLLPLPNPLITLPSSLRGNGASGPLSGPAVGSRGPSGLMIVVVVWKYCFSFLIFDPSILEPSRKVRACVRKWSRCMCGYTGSVPINVQLTRLSNPNLDDSSMSPFG